MAGEIKTAKVTDRRLLCFHGMDDILADVDGLAQSKNLRNLGNWSPGQIFKHLALVMEKSIDGYGYHPPAVVRLIARTFFKRRFLTKPMPAGFKLPSRAQAELGPPPTSMEEGLASVRHALERLRRETKRASHPAFGQLTLEEWTQLHCRHSEMHLSFLIPVE